MTTLPPPPTVRTLGRYALFDEIAAGGMATVHLGRLLGPVGFSRTVAIKRLHAHFAKDPDFAAGFVDEARLAARIHHPNVVPIIDVLAEEGELSLVMDYVEGDSLAKLLRHSTALGEEIPLGIISAIACGCLYGLHAAHEAVDERGQPMQIVHRDISPQNVLVGSDGVPRIVDFGVAKAAQRLQTTAEGQIKGKVSYMAPEQIRLAEVGRQSDVYSMGVVVWECIARRRLFASDNPANLMRQVLEAPLSPPSRFRPECPKELDQIVMKALARDPKDRYTTARQMAQELSRAVPPAPPTDVSDWVQSVAFDGLTARRKVRARIEAFDPESDQGTVDELVSRPEQEDLPTVAQQSGKYWPPGPDDSTQAVTGATTVTSAPRGRLLLPLVAGLLAVVAAVVIVLLIDQQVPENIDAASSPVLEGQVAPDTSSAKGNEERADEGGTSEDGILEGDSNASPTDATETAASDPALDPAPLSPPTPASEDSESASSQGSRSRAPTPSPAACPKFIEVDGIRRVNRKCW